MQRRIEQMPLPFFMPDGADIDRVGKTFDRRRIPMRLIRCLTPELIPGCAFPELIGDPPTRDVQQPVFERAGGALILRDVFRDRDHRFLHDILRLGIAQSRATRHAVNQLPVALEEFLPSSTVFEIDESLNETASGHKQRVTLARHEDEKIKLTLRAASGAMLFARMDR
jgi:hypothetical protein